MPSYSQSEDVRSSGHPVGEPIRRGDLRTGCAGLREFCTAAPAATGVMTPAELVRINIEAISLRATEETERDAFWLARFGERGHNFILEDNRYHLTYLAEALAAASPAVLENYARWLQSVLTTRGMCTRHIEDNFMQLARLLRDSLPEVAPATGSYLEQA